MEWDTERRTQSVLFCRRYENLVQVRCLLEGVDPQDMLNSWHTMLPACMQKWGLQRSEVCASFAALSECNE